MGGQSAWLGLSETCHWRLGGLSLHLQPKATGHSPRHKGAGLLIAVPSTAQAPGYRKFSVDPSSPLLTGFSPGQTLWQSVPTSHLPVFSDLQSCSVSNNRPPLKVAPDHNALGYGEWGDGSLVLRQQREGTHLRPNSCPGINACEICQLRVSPVATTAPLFSWWPPKPRLATWLLLPFLLTPPSPSTPPPPMQGARAGVLEGFLLLGVILFFVHAY